MGVLAFQIKKHTRAGRLVAFSSNYALYGDISARVMRTLEEMAPRVEVYRIDQCFLDLTGTEQLADFESLEHQVTYPAMARDRCRDQLDQGISLARSASTILWRMPVTGFKLVQVALYQQRNLY